MAFLSSRASNHPRAAKSRRRTSKAARVLGASTLLASLILAPALSGCDTERFAAQQSLGLIARGAASLQRHWDLQLVGDAMPGAIVQLEGIYATLPDESRVGLELMRAYISYGFGWIEDLAERAEMEGDLDRQTQHLTRAKLLYLRARDIGLDHLRSQDHELEASVAAGARALEAHLNAEYTDRADVPLLLWTGYAWGLAIKAGTDDPELVLQVPMARALVARAVALDESYFDYGGVAFLAAMSAAATEETGGDPDAGRALFEHAMEETDGEIFTIPLLYASTYAVTTGDRELYERLLRSIVEGGDPRPESRLANRLAQRRAARMLERVDEFF